jgi:selenocysteine lyase/cysteine desulfurase
MSDSIDAVVSPFMPDAEKLAAVREALPAAGAGIFLNTGTTGPIPGETATAMAEAAQWEVTTGRAHDAFHEEALAREDEARAAVGAIVHADLDEIALMHGTTDGVNAALWSVDWRAGDNLLTTTLEYSGVRAAMIAVAERRGVEVRTVDPGPTDEATVAGFERAIDARTRAVVLSVVAYSTGERLPVTEVVRLVRSEAAGAIVVADAAQAAGAIPVAVDGLGVDFLALPAQKWLLGPEGMGALYVAAAVADRVRPAFAGAYALRDASDGASGWRTGARRFEWTNFHSPSVVGMARSCGWLSMYVGLDWVHERGAALARHASDLLAATPGITVVTSPDRLATLVSFRIAGWPPEEALEELGRRTFVIARVVTSIDAVRISTAFFNTPAEIERFCEAVAELAAHTPETLPRRPALTILGSS